MNDTTVRRTDSVRVKLAPNMLARLEKQAKLFEMPVATVCAFAVADWVQRREDALAMNRLAVEKVVDAQGEALNVSEEQMERVFGPLMVEMGKQMALLQRNLPLEEG